MWGINNASPCARTELTCTYLGLHWGEYRSHLAFSTHLILSRTLPAHNMMQLGRELGGLDRMDRFSILGKLMGMPGEQLNKHRTWTETTFAAASHTYVL